MDKDFEKHINRLLDELEANPTDSEIIEELKKIRYQIDSEINANSYREKKCQTEVEIRRAKLHYKESVTQSEKLRLTDEINSLEKEICVLHKELKDWEIKKKYLDENFTIKKSFDKQKCLRNIRFLMHEKDIKVGQIESNAEVRVGYLSRISKEDNDSPPGVLFLLATANLLGVTVDELVNGNMEELSGDEKYFCDFLRDLRTDTDAGAIHWEIEGGIDYSNDVSTGWEFSSMFYPESNIAALKYYVASLPGGENCVHFIKCSSEASDQFIPGKLFYEMYIYDEEKTVNPVCNSLKLGENANILLDSLFSIVSNNAEKLHIEPPTRAIIDSYRLKRNLKADENKPEWNSSK